MDIQPRLPKPVDIGQPGSAIAPRAMASSTVRVSIPQLPKAEVKVNIEEMKKNLDQAIKQLNDIMRDGGRNLNFAVDEVLGRPIIQVKNMDTGEVIRQIPSDAVIKFAHNLNSLKGLLLNKNV